MVIEWLYYLGDHYPLMALFVVIRYKIYQPHDNNTNKQHRVHNKENDYYLAFKNNYRFAEL